MAEFFMGQVMMTGFNFPQKYFALCNGQLLAINQNTALFSLLGTYYGGNGVNNFALPNLQGRVPIGYGSSVDPSWQPTPAQLGESSGTATVTLLTTNLPPHNHGLNATTELGAGRTPANGVVAQSRTAGASLYAAPGSTVPLQGVALSGGNAAHENMQPYQAITFAIALSGIYPSRN